MHAAGPPRGRWGQEWHHQSRSCVLSKRLPPSLPHLRGGHSSPMLSLTRLLQDLTVVKVLSLCPVEGKGEPLAGVGGSGGSIFWANSPQGKCAALCGWQDFPLDVAGVCVCVWELLGLCFSPGSPLPLRCSVAHTAPRVLPLGTPPQCHEQFWPTGRRTLARRLLPPNTPASLCLTEVPATVEVPVLLSGRVVLPCLPRSRWARCEWQHPSQDPAAYLVRSDGLEFTATEATLGTYTCRCLEAGVGGVVAAYSLVRADQGRAPGAARAGERSYSVLVGVLCFVLGVIVSSGCLLLHEWRRRGRVRRELICRERNGLDLMQSTTTSCSHEPQTPSSPEDERHPLATAKKSSGLNGYPHLYLSELEPEQARIYLAGVPLAKCDETSI